MGKYSVLIVDDEKKITEVIKSYLLNSGYMVFEADNGRRALEVFTEKKTDLVILDLMLPDMAGEEICAAIRQKSDVPIIMLTAKVEEEDILKGLKIGADDYITKPFSPRQLIARVEAVLRRSSISNTNKDLLSFSDNQLIIDDEKHEVKVNNTVVNLTPNEYRILITLARTRNRTFTREELVCLAFGDDYEGFDRTIDTHIKNLRQKIEEDPKKPKYIITVYGIGYRFGGE
ncbi:MAG: response regulator transcription factor [Bacillota bacterium]